jgi:hypothetical protein
VAAGHAEAILDQVDGPIELVRRLWTVDSVKQSVRMGM